MLPVRREPVLLPGSAGLVSLISLRRSQTQHTARSRCRANAYYRLGEVERAIEDFDQAITLDPNHAQAFNNRANAYDHLGEVERAIEDYVDVLRLVDSGEASFSLSDVNIQRARDRVAESS